MSPCVSERSSLLASQLHFKFWFLCLKSEHLSMCGSCFLPAALSDRHCLYQQERKSRGLERLGLLRVPSVEVIQKLQPRFLLASVALSLVLSPSECSSSLLRHLNGGLGSPPSALVSCRSHCWSPWSPDFITMWPDISLRFQGADPR